MKITHQYDEVEFQGMLDGRVYLYERQVESPGIRGAIIAVSCDWSAQLIDRVIELAKQGFQQHSRMTPEIVPPRVYIAYVVKPEKLQKADIAAIKAEVEAEYRAELQRRYDTHVEAVAAETVLRRTREKEKAEADAQAALFAEAKEEALALL
ncbi:hypothetical protein, partial [Streptomyces halstedii]|uniref:hypothetical protein n=1 Tax=Streptomyces halstedii TaxID=1944 RepID=UPI003416A4DB